MQGIGGFSDLKVHFYNKCKHEKCINLMATGYTCTYIIPRLTTSTCMLECYWHRGLTIADHNNTLIPNNEVKILTINYPNWFLL